MVKIMYQALKWCAGLLGYELSFSKKLGGAPSGSYETIRTSATYAPWLGDEAFNTVYDTIRPYTLVSKYRCFELWQLVEESRKAKGALIEVGVWKGGTGALIAKRAQSLGLTDTVYLCDTFAGVVKAGDRDSSYVGGEHADTSVETVREVVDALRATNTKMLVGIFPEDTAKEVSEKEFRFCHIDVDVYQSAKDVLEWMWPKLSVGGIVVFDDYGFRGCDGVARLVNEEREKKDRTFVYNLNGHAVFVKTK